MIFNEGEKIGMPDRDFSKADAQTKARYHLISRANRGHLLREAEHIYQVFLHAPPFVVSKDKERAAREEEVYQTFSQMPSNNF